MKLRALVSCLVLLVAATSASAQSIGVYADLSSASCNISVPFPGAPRTMYINVVLGGAVTGVSGAELRVTGLPVGWIAVSTPNALANINLGDPMLGGSNIVFPTCQEGVTSVNLYTVTIIPFSSVSEGLFEVTFKDPPSNPQNFCPLVTLCDDPNFTAVCMPVSEGYLNSAQDCAIAVQGKTWSEVKNLFD